MSLFDDTTTPDAPGSLLRPERLRKAFHSAINRAMPDGTLEQEFTEALLFVLSIRLNRLTGGARDMTFSARCHLSIRTARFWQVRVIWRMTGGVIDLYCAHVRNETAHCATAWRNHTRRTPQRSTPQAERDLSGHG